VSRSRVARAQPWRGSGEAGSSSEGSPDFDCAFRADLIVDERVIVEVKTVKHITDIDVAQLLTYLRLTDIRVGLIFNFNMNILKNGGIRRVVNRYVDEHGNLLGIKNS